MLIVFSNSEGRVELFCEDCLTYQRISFGNPATMLSSPFQKFKNETKKAAITDKYHMSSLTWSLCQAHDMGRKIRPKLY